MKSDVCGIKTHLLCVLKAYNLTLQRNILDIFIHNGFVARNFDTKRVDKKFFPWLSGKTFKVYNCIKT